MFAVTGSTSLLGHPRVCAHAPDSHRCIDCKTACAVMTTACSQTWQSSATVLQSCSRMRSSSCCQNITVFSFQVVLVTTKCLTTATRPRALSSAACGGGWGSKLAWTAGSVPDGHWQLATLCLASLAERCSQPTALYAGGCD